MLLIHLTFQQARDVSASKEPLKEQSYIFPLDARGIRCQRVCVCVRQRTLQKSALTPTRPEGFDNPCKKCVGNCRSVNMRSCILKGSENSCFWQGNQPSVAS